MVVAGIEGGEALVQGHKVRAPLFPLYSEVRRLLTIFQGVPKATVRSMISTIHSQTGTPQNPVDWSDPDSWITERLSGKERELAQRVWEESEHTVNPRHTNGAYLFLNAYKLAAPDGSGVYQITDRGNAFLDNDQKIVRELDDAEGLPELLSILAVKTRAMRGQLLPEWGDFLREHSRFGKPSTIKDTLRRRLVNLVERGFVERDGNAYVITAQGAEYAGGVATGTAAPAKVGADPKLEVLGAVRAFNTSQRAGLRKRLGKMHPFRFEQLVRDLLEAMGYEDVTVTKESGDKGVDVIATIQFGITTITEVVQVKRHQSNINRQVLDQLRGALPYHEAIRGTIITVGGFTKGCTEAALYPGAAPIGLIDGEKLLDLLIEHKIGIRQHSVDLYELDEDVFVDPADDEQLAEMTEK